MNDAINLMELAESLQKQELQNRQFLKEKEEKIKKDKRNTIVFRATIIFLSLLLVFTSFSFLSIIKQNNSNYLYEICPNDQYTYLITKTEGPSKFFLFNCFRSKNTCSYYKTNNNSVFAAVYSDSLGNLHNNLKRLKYLEQLNLEISTLIPVSTDSYYVDFAESTFQNKINLIPMQITEFEGNKYSDYTDFKNNSNLSFKIIFIGTADADLRNRIFNEVKNNIETLSLKQANVTVEFRKFKTENPYFLKKFEITKGNL